MIRHRLFDSYIRLRKHNGYTAAHACAFAKAMEEIVHHGLDFTGERWQGEHGGFDVTVSVEQDPYCEWDHYGTFTDRQEEGAVENPHANWHNEYWMTEPERVYDRVPGSRDHYSYFVPIESEKSHRESLIRYVGKARAAEYAHEAIERAVRFCLEPEVYTVSIQVRQAGVEVAHYCVGGWEFSEYPEVDIWLNCLPEAIEEARHNIGVILENNAA